jgi:hypothetical protein
VHQFAADADIEPDFFTRISSSSFLGTKYFKSNVIHLFETVHIFREEKAI